MTMLTLELETMGCHARVVLDAEGTHAQAALDRMPAWLGRRERILSRFDPTSALARLNACGRAEHVDELLWAAIDIALRAAGETDGLVTPTILAALEAAGYDQSFDDLPRDQSGALVTARAAPSWQTIERDASTRSIRLPPGLRLDLGGTAKGWSADDAVARLAPVGPALVELGGDIAASPAHGNPWPIAIEDPRDGRGELALVLLEQGGIATSGRDLRRWRRSGVEQHHLIDPRTGAPAITDVWTTTVIGPRALDAEIAAKRVILEGSDAGMAWVEQHPELAAIVVREDGLVLHSARFAHHVWRDVA
jgi:thiamine biosynthesis lipoprotein